MSPLVQAICWFPEQPVHPLTRSLLWMKQLLLPETQYFWLTSAPAPDTNESLFLHTPDLQELSSKQSWPLSFLQAWLEQLPGVPQVLVLHLHSIWTWLLGMLQSSFQSM